MCLRVIHVANVASFCYSDTARGGEQFHWWLLAHRQSRAVVFLTRTTVSCSDWHVAMLFQPDGYYKGMKSNDALCCACSRERRRGTSNEDLNIAAVL